MSTHPRFHGIADTPTITDQTQGPRPPEVEDFLRDGLLVPGVIQRTDNVVTLPGAPLAGSLLAELALADEIREAGSAFNTRRSYGLHVRDFRDWCLSQGLSALPAAPETVAAHLASYAIQTDGAGAPERDERGGLVARVRVSTVEQRAAAINKLHAYAGFDPPCSQQVVASTMEGLRRTFGTRPINARAAIDHDQLRGCIDAAIAPTHAQLRDRVLLLMRAQGLSAAQLASLSWADVVIQIDRVRVQVPTDGRSTRQRKLVLHGRPSTPSTCPVQAFTALRAAYPGRSLGRVLVRDDTKTFTRQGLTRIGNDLSGGRYADLPGMERTQIEHAIERVMAPSLKAVRDAALLSAGWYLAQRRSNLALLTWRDLNMTAQGIAVMIRRSKTDQTGRGKINWLVDGSDAAPSSVSPTRWLQEWHRRVCLELGGDPIEIAPDTPVFLAMRTDDRLDRSSNGELHGIGGQRINQLVAEYAESAGLESDLFLADERAHGLYGAHSLRRGFVTEALRDDKLSVAQVMQVTGHRSADQMMRYRDDANSAVQAPVRHLNAALAQA